MNIKMNRLVLMTPNGVFLKDKPLILLKLWMFINQHSIKSLYYPVFCFLYSVDYQFIKPQGKGKSLGKSKWTITRILICI